MWLRFLLFLLYMALSVSATGHQHTHSKHSHLHSPHHPHKRASNSSSHDGSSLDEARKLLAAGQAAMAHANRAIIANPRPNRLEVLNATELAKAQKPPPPLDYRNVTASSLKARDSGNGTAKDLRYSVPDELIKAARLLSENWKPSSEDLDGGYAADVQHLKDDFMIKVNDTNMMPPMLQYDSGLVKHVEEPPSAFRYSANESNIDEPAADHDKSLQKRASTEWWMATISQRGSSPFAPSGYQVWRDVKDFGAKGDGIADDTDAINKAISSGGRCGGGKCTGSTIYPATVYFPPGTYKVSSSIIQYYNTEMIGNPHDLPTILAAPSFVGLGVITSNVYTGETSQWYLNTNNFLRSVRNFIIDVRPTPSDAQVCGVHWQVAQGTSLENIHFYMTKPKDDPKTTQQGIYMENGSGGFLSDLYFVGGKYGAYMGNQQFTASGLYFEEAETAIQIHWDWGWTMQNIVVDNCKIGFTIVGGAGGPMSTGQGIGSLHMTDLRMHYVKVAVSTSIMSDNSTALLLSNSGFYYVDTIVEDTSKKQVLLPGGPKTINVDTWGFGRVTSADGTTAFHNGAKLDSPVRDPSLVTGDRRQFFTRRRPKYDDLGFSQILDAKGYGAKGDGKTDDTAVLKHLFSAAANMSAVVYIPFGVYIITDTVEIPVGSRVIGQAWPQIMATGSKFSDALHPRVAVRVGLPGQVGVVEIQNMMMTVKGATAGAIMMEWNVHESGQGSVGLWDTHFRVGGAAGTDLTVKDCPKLSGKVNKNCVAASLMLHMTPDSSGYFENVWMWTADHDFDTADQTQVDIYVGRGMLVESKGPTWLWGTSVEHCVLYQYQLSGAQNVVMGLIQTEAPYFQSFPEAPAPFTPGAFPDDPVFHDCTSKNSKSCAVAWALRIIDSSAVHVLSAGLYSFFSRYDQTCLKSGRHDCQDKIFYAEQSYDVWVQNLVTLGSVEMVSPLNGVPTLGKPNRNGFASSILAWLGGSKNVTGQRTFKGYRIHSEYTIDIGDFPEACQNALTALVRCDNYTAEWTRPSYHGVLPEEVDVDSVCDKGCAQAISDWRSAVDTYCGNSTWHNGAAAGVMGSFISQGINETCQTDKKTGKYCNDIIYDFTLSETIDKMPNNELCSDCYVGRLKMMQASPFSYYSKDSFYEEALEQAVKRCSLSSQPTTAKDSPFPPEPSEPAFCLSDVTYTTKSGDTCDSLAVKYSVSSAAIFIGNPGIQDCNDMVEGVKICLPLQCKTYKLEEDDTCMTVADATGLDQGDIRPLNPWVHELCGNLQSATETLGRVICITPPGGKFEHDVNNTNSDPAYSEYADKAVPPPKGATLAEKTTKECGRWYTVQKGDDCARVLVQHHISLSLFTQANPSVSQDDCTADLLPGRTYCVGPTKEAFAAELTPIPYWRFGCFAREAGTTNLTVLALDGISHVKPMSIIACQSYCYQQSWTVWGIQNGDSCFCDNRLRMDSQIIDDSKCNVHCNGNTTNVCGGKDAIEVFADKEMLRVEYESLGCYVHDGNTPAIQGTTGGDTIESPDEMSVDACGSLCTVDKGADFFALWRGSLCTCGMTMVPGAKKVSDDLCNVPCTGELGDDCGGTGVAEVYTNKKRYVTSK